MHRFMQFTARVASVAALLGTTFMLAPSVEASQANSDSFSRVAKATTVKLGKHAGTIRACATSDDYDQQAFLWGAGPHKQSEGAKYIAQGKCTKDIVVKHKRIYWESYDAESAMPVAHGWIKVKLPPPSH